MQKSSRILLGILLSVSGAAWLKATGDSEIAKDNSENFSITAQEQIPDVQQELEQQKKKEEEGRKRLKKLFKEEEEVKKRITDLEKQEAEARKVADIQQKHKEEKEVRARKKLEALSAVFKNGEVKDLPGFLASTKNPAKLLKRTADFTTYQQNDVENGKRIVAARKDYKEKEKKKQEKIRQIVETTNDKREVLYQLIQLRGGEAANYLLIQPNSVTLAQETAQYATYTKNDPETGKIIDEISRQLTRNYAVVRNERFQNSTILGALSLAVVSGIAIGKWGLKLVGL